MFDGLDLRGVGFSLRDLGLCEAPQGHDADEARDQGLVTREDAELAVTHGADAIVCSNHGGRADETGRSSIESLPEVLAGAAGRIPVLVDGGFRRGTDIFMALALGATAICVGRPYLWGLRPFGQEGVETVLDILTREFHLAMRYAGTPTIRDIKRSMSSSGGEEDARPSSAKRPMSEVLSEWTPLDVARRDCSPALPPAPGDRRTTIE